MKNRSKTKIDKWTFAFAFLWIASICMGLYLTEIIYQHNESWNKIRLQGLKPALVSGDGINNQILGNHYNPEFYKKYGIKNSYWNPYMFSGMPNVFSGVQHFLVVFIYAIFGVSFSFIWAWCIVIDMIPLILALWFIPSDVKLTPEEIADDRKILKMLVYTIAGGLVFYWSYAEIK